MYDTYRMLVSFLVAHPSTFVVFAVVKIKKSRGIVKFKLRLSKYLYTLKVSDMQKADKISQSFPPGAYTCLGQLFCVLCVLCMCVGSHPEGCVGE